MKYRFVSPCCGFLWRAAPGFMAQDMRLLSKSMSSGRETLHSPPMLGSVSVTGLAFLVSFEIVGARPCMSTMSLYAGWRGRSNSFAQSYGSCCSPRFVYDPSALGRIMRSKVCRVMTVSRCQHSFAMSPMQHFQTANRSQAEQSPVGYRMEGRGSVQDVLFGIQAPLSVYVLCTMLFCLSSNCTTYHVLCIMFYVLCRLHCVLYIVSVIMYYIKYIMHTKCICLCILYVVVCTLKYIAACMCLCITRILMHALS